MKILACILIGGTAGAFCGVVWPHKSTGWIVGGAMGGICSAILATMLGDL